MPDREERTYIEIKRIISFLTTTTGLPTRWNGELKLTQDAEFKGRKSFRCFIELDARLTEKPERWTTWIHEALHSLSVGNNPTDYRAYRGWEEGVVEQCQRIFRPAILMYLEMNIQEDTFSELDATHIFNPYIHALESVRRFLNAEEIDFYSGLLACPIRERPALTLEKGIHLLGEERREFLARYSAANATLRGSL